MTLPRPFLAAVVHERGRCQRCGRVLSTVYRIEFPDGTVAVYGSECYRTVLPPRMRRGRAYRGQRGKPERTAPSLFDETNETETT